MGMMIHEKASSVLNTKIMSIDAVPMVIHTLMQLILKNGVTNYQKKRKYGMIVNVLAVRHM